MVLSYEMIPCVRSSILETGLVYRLLFARFIEGFLSVLLKIHEPRGEKTSFLHMQK